MILTLILTVIVSIVNVATSWLPTVTELPFGIDEVLTVFIGTVKAVLEVMPILTVPLATMLFSYTILISLWTWGWIKWIIERVH